MKIAFSAFWSVVLAAVVLSIYGPLAAPARVFLGTLGLDVVCLGFWVVYACFYDTSRDNKSKPKLSLIGMAIYSIALVSAPIATLIVGHPWLVFGTATVAVVSFTTFAYRVIAKRNPRRRRRWPDRVSRRRG
ncbi:MAG: hypothetical protein PHT12_00905 [Patescibacteria group bacterium]|nr:hypothetical protein [Patescibacteria group bacterium]